MSVTTCNQQPVIGTNIENQLYTHTLDGKIGITQLVWIEDYRAQSKEIVIRPFDLNMSEYTHTIADNYPNFMNATNLAVIQYQKNTKEIALATTETLRTNLPSKVKVILLDGSNTPYEIPTISNITSYNKEQARSVNGILTKWYKSFKQKEI